MYITKWVLPQVRIPKGKKREIYIYDQLQQNNHENNIIDNNYLVKFVIVVS